MHIFAVGLSEDFNKFLDIAGNDKITVGHVDDSRDLRVQLTHGPYDACVINLDYAELRLCVVVGLRERGIKIPIIALSGRPNCQEESEQRARFRENGGDDFFRPSVPNHQLLAAIKSADRLFRRGLPEVIQYQVGSAKILANRDAQTILVNGENPGLTAKEMELVLLFTTNPGKAFSKEEILNRLYFGRGGDIPGEKTIDVFVCHIRRKLGALHPDARLIIATVWDHGYQLSGKVERQVPELLHIAA